MSLVELSAAAAQNILTLFYFQTEAFWFFALCQSNDLKGSSVNRYGKYLKEIRANWV
ncbi:hypothetical protein CHISP_1831 [Chitinispirillum alkaliphilum]|nr:hypothetical protein CHISP_1831 [Chitinispirillum alkaliphilum]